MELVESEMMEVSDAVNFILLKTVLKQLITLVVDLNGDLNLLVNFVFN